MNKKPSTIKQVLALQNQPIQELKQLWQQLFDEPAPPYQKNYLIPRLAHRLQELAYGPMSEKTAKQLDVLADKMEKGRKFANPMLVRKPSVGTTLIREYQGESYPFPEGEWACDSYTPNEEGSLGKHCDGIGVGENHCVSNCLDGDEDGFGQQPSELYDSSSCSLGSSQIDCNDENPFIHPNEPGISEISPYCDCDFNTGEGFTQGVAEGPININIPFCIFVFCFK